MFENPSDLSFPKGPIVNNSKSTNRFYILCLKSTYILHM